jgi:hypothetical protein
MSAVRGLRLGWFAVLSGCACLGCETAHYVLRAPDHGVVSIPEDTPELRAKAEKLMHDQFPAGYVIDDVRLVAVGRPYRTITQVGPFAEVETHQRHQVMLYYHAGQLPPAVPVRVGTPVVASPANAPVTPGVQPASATVRPGPSDGLPSQPVPVSR